MIRKIYQGFLYKPDALHFHPLIGLILLAIQFGLMLSQSPIVIYGLLLLIIIENTVFGNLRGVISLIWAIIPLLIFMGFVTFLFADVYQAT